MRIGAVMILLWASAAFAYRPFDQTDADVAAEHEFELEFGPAQALASKDFVALTPNFVLNFGIGPRMELVFDGASQLALGALRPGAARWGFDSALLLKGLLRKGSLQDEHGPSVAMEGGIVMPQLPAPGGLGAQLAVIVSQRWSLGTLHLNVFGERTREGSYEFVLGAIAEGPQEWKVRPVAEAYADALVKGSTVASILGGAIWRLSDELALDGAVRVVPARTPLFELRLGFTWSISDKPE